MTIYHSNSVNVEFAFFLMMSVKLSPKVTKDLMEPGSTPIALTEERTKGSDKTGELRRRIVNLVEMSENEVARSSDQYFIVSETAVPWQREAPLELGLHPQHVMS